ncbi:unnamed protein product [Urochloa decumbens]|uniref:Uncharacterized protein n=1 Tax=Urochloa decumbens TaxID=240449 RepID=A0ABC8VIL8_9POAL
MAGADGQRLRDLSRRASSFLLMARLALTGAAAAPALLIAEGEAVDGHICDPYYKSIRTEDSDLDFDEVWSEDKSELLVDDEDGGSTTTRAVSETSTRGGGPLNKKQPSQFIRLRPGTATAGAALRSEDDVAAAESSEPLMERRRAARRVNDAAEMVHQPFGCDRQGSESSWLLRSKAVENYRENSNIVFTFAFEYGNENKYGNIGKKTNTK